MIQDDKKFEELLNTRSVPPMRSNLEHRIIQASLKEQGAKEKKSVRPLWIAILDNIIIPQPAFAMVLVLLLGITLAGYTPNINTSDDEAELDAPAFFLQVEEIEYGDFL